MHTAKLNLNVTFVHMLVEWLCSDYMLHHDQIQLVSMAVSNGSHHILLIIHTWHVMRSLAEGRRCAQWADAMAHTSITARI